MSLSNDALQLKKLFEAGSRLFPGADDAELEGRKTDQMRKEEAERKEREKEAKKLRQKKLAVAMEKYNKILRVIDKLGFTAINPKPPSDGGYDIGFPMIESKNKDGLELDFLVDRTDVYRYHRTQAQAQASEQDWFSKVKVYGEYKPDTDDEDIKNLSRFSYDEKVQSINISTNKTEDQIANEIKRRLIPTLTASIEKLRGRVDIELVQLNAKRKMIADTVSILGLRPQTFDKNDNIYQYLNGQIDRFELTPDYYGKKAKIKLEISADALPTFLQTVKKFAKGAEK